MGLRQGTQERTVFVHFTSVLSNSKHRKLDEGDVVEFEVIKAPKGWKAQNVILLEHAR